MYNLIKKYKREFVYSSYLFLIFELLLSKGITNNISFFFLISVLGYILINVWLFSTYKLHSEKKISKYTDVILKVNLWDRLFSYVFLPLFFYTSIVVFLFFSQSNILNHFLVVISSILFFYVFLYVRTSYEKVYSINKITRVVIDFVSITVFFLLLTVINLLTTNIIVFSVLLFFLSLLSLLYILYHHNKYDGISVLFGILLSIVLVSIYFFFGNTNGEYFTSMLLTIFYYLIVSLWNVRFAGSRNISDYIPPIMYSLMAIILLLSL